MVKFTISERSNCMANTVEVKRVEAKIVEVNIALTYYGFELCNAIHAFR